MVTSFTIALLVAFRGNMVFFKMEADVTNADPSTFQEWWVLGRTKRILALHKKYFPGGKEPQQFVLSLVIMFVAGLASVLVLRK